MSAEATTHTEMKASSDVFLDASEGESSLPEVLSNTRLVSQNENYVIEDVEVTEQTEVIRLIDRFPKTIESRVSQISKLQKDDIKSKVDEEITISLTPEHISEYSQGRNSSLTPIEPVTVEENGMTREYKFAKTVRKYVASIHIKNEAGERQTVYRKYSSRDLADNRKELIGRNVEFKMSGSQLRLESTPEPDTNEDTASKSDEQSTLGQLKSALKVTTPSVLLLLSTELLRTVNIVWFTRRDIAILSLILLIVTVMGIKQYNRSDATDEDTEKESSPLKQNVSLYNQYIPLTGGNISRKVEVQSTFDDQTLTLSLPNIEDAVEWTVETTEEDIFQNKTIVEFYTELGFDKSEQNSFTAYVSPNYDQNTPTLKTTGLNKLYLYPKQPFN